MPECLVIEKILNQIPRTLTVFCSIWPTSNNRLDTRKTVFKTKTNYENNNPYGKLVYYFEIYSLCAQAQSHVVSN